LPQKKLQLSNNNIALSKERVQPRGHMDYTKTLPDSVKIGEGYKLDALEVLATCFDQKISIYSGLDGNYPAAHVVRTVFTEGWDTSLPEYRIIMGLLSYDTRASYYRISEQLAKFVEESCKPRVVDSPPELNLLPPLSAFVYEDNNGHLRQFDTFEAVAVFSYMNSVINARGFSSDLAYCIGDFPSAHSPFAVFRAIEHGLLYNDPELMEWVNHSCLKLIEKYQDNDHDKLEFVLGRALEEATEPQSI